MRPVTPSRMRAAWIVAMLTDVIQLGLLPVTATLSTWVDKPLDVVAMLVLWRLLGWHMVLLPSFVLELFPYVELAPAWTLAVWLISRRQSENKHPALPPADEMGPPR